MAIITLRKVDELTAKTLKERARKEGLSVNSFLLQLVRDSLKIGKKKRSVAYHDLDHLAGTWDRNDLAEFKRNTAGFDEIDEQLWSEPHNAYSTKGKRRDKK
jgi:hypothetical protein